jgi:hypothetical protein
LTSVVADLAEQPGNRVDEMRQRPSQTRSLHFELLECRVF